MFDRILFPKLDGRHRQSAEIAAQEIVDILVFQMEDADRSPARTYTAAVELCEELDKACDELRAQLEVGVVDLGDTVGTSWSADDVSAEWVATSAEVTSLATRLRRVAAIGRHVRVCLHNRGIV
jgi:hypothetical protein